MLLSNKIFQFYFCNHQGLAYYVDKNNNISLGNISSGIDYSIESPIEWKEIELMWARNEKYFGLNRACSPDLTFIKKAATIIRKLFYLPNGQDPQIYFIVTKLNQASQIYELYYKGELDFTQISDDPLKGVTIKTIEGGILKLFKTFENTIFELPCDGSIPENIGININGLMLKGIFSYECSPFNFVSSGTIIPIILNTKQGNDVGVQSGSQNYFEFDASDSGSILNAIKTGYYCFGTVRTISQMIISGSITFDGTMTNGRLFALSSNGATQINIIPLQEISTQTISFNQTIDIPAGSQIFLCFQTIGNINCSISSGNIQFEFKSQFEDTFCYGIKPADILNLIMQKINQEISVPGHIVNYIAKSNLLLQHDNLILIPGMSLRNNLNAVLKISLSELFEIYNAEKCACLGNAQDKSFPMGEYLFIENRSDVFQAVGGYGLAYGNMDLGEVSHLKIYPATNLKFGKLKIGYPEQKYDNKQGNDEWNTTAQYKGPDKKCLNELSLISKARGDSFGIENTRMLIGTNQASNNKSDNDYFIVNIDLSKHNNTEVNIEGDLSQSAINQLIYNNLNLPIVGRAVSLLNWPIVYQNPQGDSLKNSFDIVNDSYDDRVNTIIKSFNNSTIQFNNPESGFTSLSGIVTLNGSALAILLPIGRESGGLSSISQQSSGSYRIKFSLIKNAINGVGGDEIASTIIAVRMGGSFNAQFPFSTNLYFSDRLFMTWMLADAQYNGSYWYIPYYSSLNGQFLYNIEVIPWGLVGSFSKINISLSSSNQPPIYGVNRIQYDEFNGGEIDPDFAYNIEELTPSRMLENHGAWIRGLFYNMLSENLIFQTSDKNHLLSTTLNSKTYSEGTDQPIASMNENILILPFFMELDTAVPMTFNDLMSQSKNSHIRFSYYGKYFYFFPWEVKQKPALNETQHWKGLASPANDINNFIDFDFSGISMLNLPKMTTQISFLNPIKLYDCSITQNAKYNFIHMDSGFFIQQSAFYAQKKDYYQKWQNNDTLSIQIICNSIAPAKIQFYDKNHNKIGAELSMIQKSDPAIVSPNILFEINISLSNLNEGAYYFLLTVGSGQVINQFVSEGIQIKQTWTKTLLYEYSHSSNWGSMIFNTGFSPSFRVEGWIGGFMPKSHQTIFEDQPADMKSLYSIPYREHILYIGNRYGIPPYVLDLLNRIMGLDNVLIDGLNFTKASEDTEFELKDVAGWPLKFNTLQIREAQNKDGISATTEGSIEEEITTNILVNQKGFGEFTNDDNIVTITKIE